MRFIDTHCHLYAEEFENDIGGAIERAVDAGVEKFYLPAIDSSTLQAMVGLEKKYPGKCFAMIGLHPCSVKGNFKDEMKVVNELLEKRKFAAIGEIGLDFYWDRNFDDQQYEAFHQQMEWALQHDLPIVIHSRNSMKESIGAVKQHQNGKLKGIFHCFSGDIEDAKEIIGLGFYIGIGGTVTYKKSFLPEVLKNIGLEYIVLETDAPYLAPVPFRGKRNESSYLVYIAEKLAEIKNMTLSDVAKVTTANAEKIFGN
ncbi:MAG: TatD family hydrolase [Bacteroidetes bacterium]|nr:TatD family hydrolase [Bacteroidota bacterium]